MLVRAGSKCRAAATVPRPDRAKLPESESVAARAEILIIFTAAARLRRPAAACHHGPLRLSSSRPGQRRWGASGGRAAPRFCRRSPGSLPGRSCNARPGRSAPPSLTGPGFRRVWEARGDAEADLGTLEVSTKPSWRFFGPGRGWPGVGMIGLEPSTPPPLPQHLTRNARTAIDESLAKKDAFCRLGGCIFVSEIQWAL
jgi:hypothetical protein